MIALLDWIFRRNDPPPYDYEKAVGKFLLALPRCSSKVIVASPKYDSEHYFGEVAVDTVKLIPWAEHHSTACWSSCKEQQAARLALPLWIRGADPEDVSPTYLLEPFMRVLLPYKLDFVMKGIAEISCGVCGSVTKDVQRDQLNKRNAGRSWKWWTDKWICPEGHVIYQEDHEMHIYFGSHKD